MSSDRDAIEQTSLELHENTNKAPAPDRESHNLIQLEKFNAEESREFFQRPLPEDITSRLSEIVDLIPGISDSSRVIDVGCGTGCLIPPLRARGARDILAVDLAPNMLSEVEARYGTDSISGNEPGVRTWCGDFVDLPTYQGPVDVITMNAVFGNVFDQRAALLRAALLLAPGGHLLLSHPLGREWHQELHALDPGMVPHDLPDRQGLESMVRDLPLRLLSYRDVPAYAAVLQVPPAYALGYRLRLEGPVVVGFGRGSKQMGVPTANLEPAPLEASGALPPDLPRGVYFGWAQLHQFGAPEADGEVHPMVMNVGVRPTVEDGLSHTSIEAHIMHTYAADFHGCPLKLLVLGFLRPEMRFEGFAPLIARIRTDIGLAASQLAGPVWAPTRHDGWFRGGGGGSGGGTTSGDPPPGHVRFLGRALPQVGLGLAALGRPGYINLAHPEALPEDAGPESMREHCYEVLDAAHAAGIRYFDAARSYGAAESFLSGWCSSRGVEPDSVVLGSKWGYIYTADWRIDNGGEPHEVKEHTLRNLRAQTEETSALFPDEALSLYQIHSATAESGVLSNLEVLTELGRLKATRGWRIGLSVSGPQQGDTIRQALSVEDPHVGGGARLFDCVQATWNLLEQSAGPALAEAAAAGLDIIVKEGMANGRLLGDAGGVLAAAAGRHATTVDALALAVVMTQPWRPMVLSGAASVAHVQSNAAALRVAPELSGEEVAELMAAVVQEPAAYWQERAQLEWN